MFRLIAPALRTHTLPFAISLCLVSAGFIAMLPAANATDQEPLPPDAPVVLHFGDSFVHVGFTQTLAPKFREGGARYVVRAKHSLYTTTISRALEIPSSIAQLKPSLVIINIGGNEMEMPIPSIHASAIRQLSATMSVHGTSCVWVTPPPPAKGETGIVGEIKRGSAPCRVFDSTPIAASLVRETYDKVHPTRESGAKWAEAFWTWLQQERDPSAPWKLKPRPSPESDPPVIIENVPSK